MNVFSLFGSIKLNDQEYQEALRKAERSTKRVGDKMERDWGQTLRNMERAAVRLGESMTQVGRRLTTTVTLPLTAISAGVIKVAADFESSMNRVSAVSGATGEDLKSLENLAKELGASTQFSASQAADAMGFLAMAGFETDQIMSALPGTLELAAAGQLDLAEAADIASNVLTGFGLEAAEIGRVNDVLAKTASSANTNVRQMGEGMSYVAPVAAGLGFSVEETSAAMGLLSNAGIQASSAGTSLRVILGVLTQRADELGIQMRDSAGNMLPLADILGQLEDKGFSAEQAIAIFGQRGGPGLTALLSQGSDALAEFTGDLEGAEGTAARMAETQMQGLRGAFLELKSAIEAVALAIADSGLSAWVEGLVDRLSGFIRSLANLNPAILRFGTVLGILAAATGPVLLGLGAILQLLPTLRAGILAVRGAILATNPILLGIAMLAAGVFVAWQKNFLGIQDVTKRVVDWVGEKISTLMTVGRAVIASWETVQWGFGEILTNMGEAAGGSADVIIGSFNVAVAAVEGAFHTMGGAIRRVFSDMLNGIIRGINSFTGAANSALGALGLEIGQIPEIAVDSWSDIADETTRRIDEANDRVEQGQERVRRAVDETGQVARAVQGTIIDNARTASTEVASAAEATEESVESVGDILEETFAEDVPDALGTTGEAVSGVAEDVAELGAELDAIFGALGGSGGTTEDPNRIPVALDWRDRQDEAIMDALFGSGRLGETSEPPLSRDIALNLRRMQDQVIFDALFAAGGGATEDPTRKPVALDWQDRQDEAIFGALFGGSRGEGSAEVRYGGPTRVDLALRWQDMQDEAIFDALFATDGGTTDNPARQNVALDWQDRQDQAIFDALFASGRLGEESEGQRGVAIALRLREQQDEAIFDALFGSEGGTTDDVTKVPVSLEWAAERDQAIFDALFGGASPESSRSGSQYGERGTRTKEPTFLDKAKEGLDALGQGMLNMAKDQFPLVGSALEGFAQGPVQGIIAVFTELLSSSEAWKGVQEVLSEMMSRLAMALQPLIQAFLLVLEALWPIIDVAIALITTALQPLAWILENVFAPVITFVAKVIAGIWNALVSAVNWALGWLGVNLPKVSIPSAGGESPDPGPTPGGGAPFPDRPGEPIPSPLPGDEDDEEERRRREQSFGSVNQGVQLAVATPLVEAAVSMKASANIIAATLGEGSPLGSLGSGFGEFTGVLDRMTPVLERLLEEGIDINASVSGSGTQQQSRTAVLRGA